VDAELLPRAHAMSSTLPDSETRADDPPPTNAPPILHLDGTTVELSWVHAGTQRYESLSVDEPGAEPLVAGARSLIHSAKLGRQGIVVCLADTYFDSRQVLLGKLPDDEAATVLERKAANGLGISRRECIYWARRCVTPVASATANQSTWLVHSQRRADHLDLLLRLRKAGIRVRRVIAGRDVLTHMLRGTDPEVGNILLTNTGHAVYVQLFRGEDLVQESRLDLGPIEDRSDVYATVMQDVRQLTAFWSKGSRGAPLQAVRFFGFTDSEVDSMRATMGIASQGAEIRVVGSPESGSNKDVRKRLLGLFMTHGTRSRDLRLPLPTRVSRLVALAVSLSLVTGAGTWKLIEYSKALSDQQSAEIASELVGTENVGVEEIERSAYLSARDSLVSSIDSLERISVRGLPLNRLIDNVYETLGRVVDVQHLAFKKGEEGPEFLFEGSLPDAVASAADQLEQLRRAAQLDQNFTNIKIQPSSRVPSLDQGETLTFTFTGALAGGDT